MSGFRSRKPLTNLFYDRYPLGKIVEDADAKSLAWEISTSLLGEGILHREDGRTVIGALLINTPESVLKSAWKPEACFFRQPIQEHAKFLLDYSKFFELTSPGLSLGWMFSKFLPWYYPFCEKVILILRRTESCDCGEQFPVSSEYDYQRRELTLRIYSAGCKLPADNESADKSNADASHYMFMAAKSRVYLLSKAPSSFGEQWAKSSDLMSALWREVRGDKDKAWAFVERLCMLAAALTDKSTPEVSAVGFLLKAYIATGVRSSRQTRSAGAGFGIGDCSPPQVLPGVLWLVYKDEWKEIETDERPLQDELARYYLQPLASRFQLLLLTLQSINRRKAEIRAAAATIMARNFSHNIGSHVTPRTRLENLLTRVRELLYNKSWWEGDDWNQEVYPAIAELKDTLDEYIQRKAEFIAEWSTDPRISIRSADFFRDLMLPFMSNTALIDTLAANEGFRYRAFDAPGLVIRCFRKTKVNSCDEYVPRFRTEWASTEVFKWPNSVRGAPFAMRHPDAMSTELIADDFGVPDIRLALPGPVGEMALYGIIENIVRNAAKHSKRHAGASKGSRRLEIHVVVDEGKAEDPDCLIRIYDSLSEPAKKLVDDLNKWIRAPLVGGDGQCRKEAWGLAEMGLCADLLGGRTPGESDDPPNLSVAEIPKQDVEPFLDKRHPACLSYSLKVAKARTAVFYGWAEVNAHQRDKLAGSGFLVCAASKPLASATLDGRHATQFAVLDSRFAETTTNWEELRRALPPRLIVAGEVRKPKLEYDLSRLAFINKIPALADSARQADTELTPCLWQAWLRHLGTKPGRPGPDARLMIDLFLQQDRSIEPTATFCRKADKYNEAFPARRLPVAVRVWGTEQQDLKCFTDKNRNAQNMGGRLIVDRHGIFVSESGYSPQTSDRLFWIDKQNRDFDLLFNPSSSNVWTLPYELAEAGMLRILILDERILQNAMKPFAADGVGRDGAVCALTGSHEIAPLGWHAAERAGVYLVTHLDIADSKGVSRRTFDIAAQDWNTRQTDDHPELRLPITFRGEIPAMGDFHAQRWPASKSVGESDKAWQAGGMPLNIAKGIDVAVVHQGVIDRINDEFKDVNDAGGQFMKALSGACTLIVESGRGIPPEVQKNNERFLPFSSIERAFHGGRVAKLLLTRTVMETTRRRGV